MPCHPGLALVLSAALLGTTTLLPAATVLHTDGTIYLDGTDGNFALNDGAILDATTMEAPSSFNANGLTNNGPTDDGLQLNSGTLHGPYQLSTIPVSNLGGTNYFEFILDVGETKDGGPPPQTALITVTEVTLQAGTILDGGQASGLADAATIWSNANPIQLNGELPAALGGTNQIQTDTPLGAGGDMIVLVPFSLFGGYTSDNYINFRTMMTNSDNGDDEWALNRDAVGAQFVDPGTMLPEPSSTLLVLLAGAFALMRRRR